MRKIYLLLLLLPLGGRIFGQAGDYHGGLSTEGIVTTPDHVPFWLRSDQYGSVPLAGGSASLIANLGKSYDSSKQRLFDWGFALEARANFGNDIRAAFIEAYVKARFSIFEFRAGRDRNFMGLVDSTLSSGAFSVSGNALGIPKLEGAIRDWYILPFAGHLFSIKGNFAVGRIGDVPINEVEPPFHALTYFHQASLYARLGKPDWRLKLDAGINHQVYWGSEGEIHLGGVTLPSWQVFEYVVIGKTYEGSKIGNHLGSVDFAAEYEFDNFRLMLYRQFFFDEGALAHLANLADGMNGISLTNKRPLENGFSWHKLVVEWFYSMNQAGYPWSKKTPSGDENYYNNYQYLQGWSYLGQAVGNPFITPYPTTRKGFPSYPGDYFNNNRVCAFYGALEGGLAGFTFTTRLSYSLNYGTFATSPWGYSTGGRFAPPKYGIFPEQNQFSAYLKISKFINHNTELGITGSLDNGGLFYNSAAFVLHARRTF
jgi:Capsule assembly protein Wzi